MNIVIRRFGTVAVVLGVSGALGFCAQSSAKNETKKPGVAFHIAEKISAPTKDDYALSGALNGFGFKLLRKLDAKKAPDANILFSPLSIFTALTLVEQGANGQTKTELQKMLQPAGFSTDRVLNATCAITRGWQSADSGVQVDIANSLWLDRKYTLKLAFVQTAKTSFDASVRVLDFASLQAAPTINDWISGKTHEKIKDMVSSEALRNAALVIANAVYFKGKWQHAFDAGYTRDGDFYLSSGQTLRTPMMNMETKSFSYFKAPSAALVAFPYGKGYLGLVLLVPDKNVALSQVVARLDNAHWDLWMKKMKNRLGTIKIPRFTLESDTTLNETLKQLGIVTAFSPVADFSSMTTGAYISAVKHKAWMKVNESGTEAAAKTTTVFNLSNSELVIEEPFQFIADRPFLAAIRDNRSGNLLFLAEVNQPLNPS